MAGDLEQLKKKLFEFRIFFFGTLPDLNYSYKLYPMVCRGLGKVYSSFYFTIKLIIDVYYMSTQKKQWDPI